MKELKAALKDKLGITLSSLQDEQFTAYISFLVEYNQHTNLTRIPENDIPLLHFYDSLSVCEFIDFSRVKNLIDIGSGPGFPGIPLKIIHPHLEVTLVDSRNKKVTFLKELITKLGLEDIEAIHARAEELSDLKKYQNKFEVVTARAVAETKELLELLFPFKGVKGKIVLYKGPKAEEELKAAKKVMEKNKLNSSVSHTLELPGSGHSRTILVLS